MLDEAGQSIKIEVLENTFDKRKNGVSGFVLKFPSKQINIH